MKAIPAESRRTLATMLAGLAMLGPFSIDAYLPAFPDIARDLGASSIEVQQSMTAYLVGYAIMMLWHGSISDAIGRRPVILASVAVYAFGSLGCGISGNIHSLVLFRIVQGLSAGAGLAVGRVIIRDRYHGAAAQKMMSEITMMFSIAPAIAPILGGVLLTQFGWRGIFGFLVVFTLGLFSWCWRSLPETHPPELRQSMRPKSLWINYRKVLLRIDFLLVASSLALFFCGLFLYIASAPVFLIQHLHVSAQGFAWLFLPAIGGIMVGAYISGRRAGRFALQSTIAIGFAVMYFATIANLAICFLLPPMLPWNVLPLFVYTLGMSLVTPSATLILLDLFPSMRGLASSMQIFVQVLMSSVVAGVVSPLLSGSVRALACGLAFFLVLSSICWILYRYRSPLSSLGFQNETP